MNHSGKLCECESVHDTLNAPVSILGHKHRSIAAKQALVVIIQQPFQCHFQAIIGPIKRLFSERGGPQYWLSWRFKKGSILLFWLIGSVATTVRPISRYLLGCLLEIDQAEAINSVLDKTVSNWVVALFLSPVPTKKQFWYRFFKCNFNRSCTRGESCPFDTLWKLCPLRNHRRRGRELYMKLW